jgi:N-acetylated-alpha-linked acidic dipeptidase
LNAEPVSRERLAASATALAQWTKHAGTPEELESLCWVEREVASYGYATELLFHDAYVSLPGKARVVADGEEVPCITHSFSRATAGIEGKFPVVDGLAMPGSVARGAVAQIHVSPHEHLHEMCISPVWGSPDDVLLERLPTAVVVTVPLSAGDRVRSAASVRIEAEVDTGWRPTPILIAELAQPDEPFVLFSGHHDAWYIGAMDNGGANATMLEVARVCAARRSEWRRGLRLAFWSGHSQGRYSSSAWYADTHWEELEARCVAHVNVDSTGGRGNVLVDETTASGELRALAREAIASHAGQEFAGRRMHRAGDQSFWGIGVSSIFGNMGQHPPDERIGFGTGWWWHTPDDTLDKIDEELLVRDTRIYEHVVSRLLESPVPPLDFAETARDLVRTLEERDGAVDLSLCIERAHALATRAERFSAATHDDPVRAWECLRRVGRALVPIDYTEGDRFGHDAAVGQQAVPSLIAGSADAFARTRLVRAANRVAFGLREANRAFDEYLGA